jgi:hypothetical protein
VKTRSAFALLYLLAASPVAAQDSTVVPAPVPDSLRALPPAMDTLAPASADPAGTDSVPVIRPPISPMGAFWRSLLVPGWGQARLGRRTAGAFFMAFEGVALGMTLTASSQLKYLEQTNSGSVDAKSQQREDWLVLLGVNHLLAAMEAYVSAHLWDFPGDLTIQAAPNGGVTGAVSVPVRLP